MDRIQFLESVLELEDLVEQELGGGTEGEAGGAGQAVDVVSDREASRASNSIEDSDGVKVSRELAKSKVIKAHTMDLDIMRGTDMPLGCSQ